MRPAPSWTAVLDAGEAIDANSLFVVTWHGGKLHHVSPWSLTKGELLAPRRQAERPEADPTNPDVDAFGLFVSPARDSRLSPPRRWPPDDDE